MTTKQQLDLNVEHVGQDDHTSGPFPPVVRRSARVANKKVPSNDESFDVTKPDKRIGGDDHVDKSNAAATASVNKPDSDQVNNSLTLKKLKTMPSFDGLADKDVEEDDSSSGQSENSESEGSSHSASDGKNYDSDSSSIEFIGTYRPPCPVHSKKFIASVENTGIDTEVEEKEEKKSDLKIDGTKRKEVELSRSNDDVHSENSNAGPDSELEVDRVHETNKKPKIAFKVIKGSRKGKKK